MPAVTKKSTPAIVVILAVLVVIAGAWAALRLVPGSPFAASESFVLDGGDHDSFADSGSAADISRVQAAVQGALTSEDNGAAVDADHQAVLTHAKRVALLAQNETPAHAATLAGALEFAMTNKPFVQSGRFVVKKWQGVVIGAHSAKAYVTGYDLDRQVDGTSWADEPYEAHVLLTRSSSAQHGWLVTKMISSPLAD